MPRVRIALALLALWPGAGTAEEACAPPLGDVAAAARRGAAELAAVDAATETARQRVIDAYRAVDAAAGAVMAARARRDEPALDRAVAALGRAKAEYDAAVAAERPLLIARLEAERANRGAQQALSEAARRLREQGEALMRAAARAARGEVAPSLTDLLACEQGDCGRVGGAEHAALVTIGAVADTVDLSAWPPTGRACDFTLFDAKVASAATWRTLRAAARIHDRTLKEAEAALTAARQSLAAAIPGWERGLNGVLETYANPVGNSHADELLGMAIEELTRADAAFDPLAAAYRRADEAATEARRAAVGGAAEIERHLDYWDAVGRAVIDAAAGLERGTGRAEICGRTLTAATTPWVFAVTPPADCAQAPAD